jgi:hypothetical protein
MKKAVLVCVLILAIVLSLLGCDQIAQQANDEIARIADSGDSGSGAGKASDSDATAHNTASTPSTSDDSYGEVVDGYYHGGYAREAYIGKATTGRDGYYEDGGIIMGDYDPAYGPDYESNTTPRAGLLTACAYADQENIDYWQGLLTSTQEGEGEFAQFFETYAFKPYRQVTVTTDGVAGKKVWLAQGDKMIFGAVTNNAGVAYLYAPEDIENAEVVVDVDYLDVVVKKKVEGDVVAFTKEELAAQEQQYDCIQIMFVIDTTGSMGDEINYLKKEIADVIARIEAQTNAEVLLAIMVYRDTKDAYLTDYSDFTSDIDLQQAYLSKQYAQGGGDFPEAVDVAMTEAVAKQWVSQATKIIVHVADAPSHDKDVAKWEEAAEQAARQGIRIVSVASSGIDKMTEYCFRSQSLMTGGVYVYLTNDSGIGGDHLEGSVSDRPQVEALNDCLVRVIGALHQGTSPITIYPEKQEEQQPEQQEEQEVVAEETVTEEVEQEEATTDDVTGGSRE